MRNSQFRQWFRQRFKAGKGIKTIINFDRPNLLKSIIKKLCLENQLRMLDIDLNRLVSSPIIPIGNKGICGMKIKEFENTEFVPFMFILGFEKNN